MYLFGALGINFFIINIRSNFLKSKNLELGGKLADKERAIILIKERKRDVRNNHKLGMHKRNSTSMSGATARERGRPNLKVVIKVLSWVLEKNGLMHVV